MNNPQEYLNRLNERVLFNSNNLSDDDFKKFEYLKKSVSDVERKTL